MTIQMTDHQPPIHKTQQRALQEEKLQEERLTRMILNKAKEEKWKSRRNLEKEILRMGWITTEVIEHFDAGRMSR